MGTVRLGCWIDLPSPQIAEMVGGSGFDYGVIDLEHSAIGIETAQLMIMALQARGVQAIVRVPDHSEAWTKRMLDAGADGLIVPRVESAAEGEAIVRNARYAPVGARGEALAVARAARWGRDIPAYRDRWQTMPYLAMQIESAAGYQAVADIAAVAGVTQLFFGPSDYSASIGTAFDAPEVMAAAEGVAKAAQAQGLRVGTIFPGKGRTGWLADVGYTDIAVASDVVSLNAAFDGALVTARSEIGDGAA